LRRRSHGQTIKKNIESRKYSFRPPGGLALWSLAARLAARAWSLPDDPTDARTLAVALFAGTLRLSDRTE